MCQVCWERDKRVIEYDHAHHIKPRETHPQLVMDPTNIMLLCEKHHDETHAQQRAGDPMAGRYSGAGGGTESPVNRAYKKSATISDHATLATTQTERN
ncbi:MAG: hypothetical protein CMJ50_01160 [Planctomycetaceae bacterium]|nr:hypothetical protein [Planctomycetaceae bacterium]